MITGTSSKWEEEYTPTLYFSCPWALFHSVTPATYEQSSRDPLLCHCVAFKPLLWYPCARLTWLRYQKAFQNTKEVTGRNRKGSDHKHSLPCVVLLCHWSSLTPREGESCFGSGTGLSVNVPVLDGLLTFQIITGFQGMVPSFNSLRELVTKIHTLMTQVKTKRTSYLELFFCASSFWSQSYTCFPSAWPHPSGETQRALPVVSSWSLLAQYIIQAIHTVLWMT